MADHSLDVTLDPRTGQVVILGGENGKGRVVVTRKRATIQLRLAKELKDWQISAVWIQRDAFQCPPARPTPTMPGQFTVRPPLPANTQCTLTDALDDAEETVYHYCVGITNPGTGETRWTDPEIVNKPQAHGDAGDAT